ncbi:MAG: peptide MFS transporter [Lachnospirales bacterium]
MENVKNKRPFGFYVCSVAFAFERMAFYSVKWILAYFIIKTVSEGGLGLSETQGANFQANFVAFTYIAPILLGFLADRFVGARHCVSVGMILMGVGYIVAGFATDMTLLYVMLFLVSVGTGLFKGNLTAMIGRLFYSQEELDAAYSIYYSFVNIGSFIGTTIVAYIVIAVGYRPAFIIYGVITLIGFLWYFLNLKHLGDVGIKPFSVDERNEEVVVDEPKKKLTKVEKNRMIAIVAVSAFSIVFWLFWYLAYLPVYYHWDEAGAANWTIASFTVPSAWFDSLNGLACIALGPILAMVWARLAKRPQGDLSLFKKTSLGLLLMGASYLIFAFAEITRGEGQASLLWIIIFGILLSLGEMCFSPLGNSFVSKYAPARFLSVMMGVWIVAAFVAAKTYGYVYDIAFGEGTNFVLSNFVIAGVAIASAVIIALCDKTLMKLLEEKE